MKKAKAHKRYKTKDGEIVVGVTTVCNLLAKPFLIKWANNLGLKGIDSAKFVDELADIGTLAHYFIECDLKKQLPDLSDFTPNQIKLAKNSKKKFDTWLGENKFEVIDSELELVSESLKFGGCCDVYCMLNDKKTLIDLKTSKNIYPEHYTQVSAYKALLEENGKPVEDVRILRIGRDDKEGFDDKRVPYLDLHWQRFRHLLAIYRINQKI